MLLLSRLIVFFIVFLFSSYCYLYFFRIGATSIKPLYWYVFAIAAVMFLALLSKKPPSVSQDGVLYILWICMYLLYSVANFIYSSESQYALDLLVLRFEVAVLMVAFYYLLQQGYGARSAQSAMLWVTIFGVLMNYVDFLWPSMSEVAGRAAGFYQNPNISGKFLVLSMIASIPLVAKKLRLPYCLLTGTGVFLTFSRSSWIVWTVAVIGLAAIGYVVLKNRALGIVSVAFVAIVILYATLTGGLIEFLAANGLSDYLNADTLARLGGDGGAFQDDSTASRLNAAWFAWLEFAENPVFGGGLAVTKEWVYAVEPHNLYLLFAAQGGIFGLTLVLVLFFVLWRITDRIGRLLVVVFSIGCLFSHTMLNEPAMLIILALIAAARNEIGNVVTKDVKSSSSDGFERSPRHYA